MINLQAEVQPLKDKTTKRIHLYIKQDFKNQELKAIIRLIY